MPHVVYSDREGRKFNTDTTLVVVTCYSCKITYAIPQSLYQSAHRYPGDSPNGWKICCPLGHTWYYKGTNIDQDLKSERERAARLSAALDQEKAHARGQKSRATRFKNQRDSERRRSAHGVCPCCGRTIKQLARHMRSQHPDFIERADAEVPPE